MLTMAMKIQILAVTLITCNFEKRHNIPVQSCGVAAFPAHFSADAVRYAPSASAQEKTNAYPR